MDLDSRMSRSDSFGEKKSEVRFEVKETTLAVLDGYCSATGKCRTAFINGLLEDWAKAKAHEAMMICRVAGINPMASEAGRK